MEDDDLTSGPDLGSRNVPTFTYRVHLPPTPPAFLLSVAPETLNASSRLLHVIPVAWNPDAGFLELLGVSSHSSGPDHGPQCVRPGRTPFLLSACRCPVGREPSTRPQA